jgi:hypothetical protein
VRREQFLLAVLLATAANAQPSEPVVRVEVSPPEVAVGEPVAVKLTVLCPTWFAKPPVFPSGELANAITRLPENGTYSTSERVEGESWSGVVYNYQVYPMLGAAYRFSGETVGVTCAVPGTIKGETVDVVIPDVVFQAVVPSGAESLDPYVAGSAFTLERTLEGEPGSLDAGDALVATYVAELDGLPAMFLPPLVSVEEAPGVSTYPDQPVVEDQAPARRTEKVTFVFEAGGDFVIPGASLAWWNRDSEQIETASVEPMTVSVVGDPLPVPEEEAPPAREIHWRRVLILLLVLYVAWRLFNRLFPRLEAAMVERRRRRLASEEHAFGQLERALLGSDRRKAQAALLEWLPRIAPGSDLGTFVERYGDEKLQDELRDASETLYRSSGGEVHMKRLLIPLTRTRRRAHRERRARAEQQLPPLNP